MSQDPEPTTLPAAQPLAPKPDPPPPPKITLEVTKVTAVLMAGSAARWTEIVPGSFRLGVFEILPAPFVEPVDLAFSFVDQTTRVVVGRLPQLVAVRVTQ